MFGKKKTVSWTSDKTSAENAQRALAEEIDRMTSQGYTVLSTGMLEAGRSKKSWVALGVLNFARSKQVQTTAVFSLVEPQPTVGLAEQPSTGGWAS